MSALAADLTTPANCDREISAQTSDCLFSNLLGVSYSEFYESVNASDGRYNRWNFTWFEPYGVIFKNIHDDQISGYVLFNDDLKKPILVDVKHSDPTYQYEFKFILRAAFSKVSKRFQDTVSPSINGIVKRQY